MSLSPQFLDELRNRTTLSALIGQTLKLTKKGREFEACCPFHNEKTASFTVSDEKGFYHCFGCGAHGDAIRWLTDARGLAFMDAVKDLAAAAGVEVPARSAQVQERDRQVADVAQILDKAAAWFAQQLAGEPKVLAALATRGIGPDAVEKFGLGFAPKSKSVSSCGVPPDALQAAGLLILDEASGLYRDRFRGRIMIPIHDARGRVVGFAGRIHGQGDPKYINSPDSGHFNKGDLLFSLHRAAPAARASRRLLVVEGQLDVVGLDSVGIAEAVAPMGTAVTEKQLERAWRVAHCPVLLLDGDAAGRKAALRAVERAMPSVGPGKSLSIALLPDGEDPDSLARSQGREAVEAAVAAARPLSAWLYDDLFAAADVGSPEGRAALWQRLAKLAGAIVDQETRDQYLADWRRRFDEAFPPPPPGLSDDEMLPDGSAGTVSGLGERDRTRVRAVAARWLDRTAGWAADTPKTGGKWAWDVGRRVACGLLDEESAQAALDGVRELLVAKYPPKLVASDADPAAEQPAAANAPVFDPADFRRSYDIGKRRGFDPGPLLLDMKCAQFERTDMGNAERWLARYGRDYLYTTAKGWLGWDGRRYRVLNQEKDVTPAEVMASVFKTVRGIQDEARFVRDTGWPEGELVGDALEKHYAEHGDDPRKPYGMNAPILGGRKVERMADKLAAWGRTSESAGRLGCIANLAKRWVTVELTDFDTDPMLLNCLNGTLRFYPPVKGPDGAIEQEARVELQGHSRDDKLTKLTACEFDPEAPAPHFQKLVKWAQPDRAVRRYLRQWLGYNLTGDMGEQIFQIWYGPLAANGKSTVGNACREAIGDYGDTTNVETFLDEGPKKRGDQATPDLVRLPGVRFLTAGEPPKGAKINEALINSVTGGDPMLARDNFRSFFRFLPLFKFTLWCNDLPAIPQGTAGIWRRVKVMLWNQHLTPEERDRDLPKKLRAEYAGVLAWMVRGLLDWMDNGFVEPESVKLASADYKQDSDPLSAFLRLCTVEDPDGRCQSSVLYECFQGWCKAAGEREWTQKGFSQALKAKGLASKASNGMHWLGIRQVKHREDFVDSQGNVRQLDDMAPAASAPPAPPQFVSNARDLPV